MMPERELLMLAGAAVAALLLIAFFCRSKRVYFIRHGRTLLNEQRIKQGAEGGLSESGKAQARIVGAALRDAHIGVICSSPYERAKETAELIRESVHAPIRYTPLLAERKNPSEVIGKPVDDPEVKKAMGATAYGFHDDEYRYADEENFVDLKARAKKCLAYLESRPASVVCAVTHHAFLHMLLSYMLVGERLTAAEFTKLSFFNPAENGGITVCEYSPLRRFTKGRGWEIWEYNATIPGAPAE